MMSKKWKTSALTAALIAIAASVAGCGGGGGSDGNQAEIKPISYPKNIAIISPVTY